jgi:hypothetical protein
LRLQRKCDNAESVQQRPHDPIHQIAWLNDADERRVLNSMDTRRAAGTMKGAHIGHLRRGMRMRFSTLRCVSQARETQENKAMRSKTTAIALVATLAFAATASVCRAESITSKAFAKDCSRCHEVSDFEGQSAGKIADKLTAIVQGKAKHRRKLQMTPDEIQLMSQYLGGQ